MPSYRHASATKNALPILGRCDLTQGSMVHGNQSRLMETGLQSLPTRRACASRQVGCSIVDVPVVPTKAFLDRPARNPSMPQLGLTGSNRSLNPASIPAETVSVTRVAALERPSNGDEKNEFYPNYRFSHSWPHGSQGLFADIGSHDLWLGSGQRDGANTL